MTQIGIIGGGAWGTALACVAARAGGRVTLWAREAEVVADISRHHENRSFLPGIALDPAIGATFDLKEACAADILLVVTPAQFLRRSLEDMLALKRPATPLVLCAKGIEEESGLLMSEVAAAVDPSSPIAVLSGPTFAAEVARGLPAAVTIAAEDQDLAQRLAARLGQARFRPYVSDDPIGAQIGGAVKNVLAIACGILAGRQLGENARAALITRGLAEMLRFGLAKGAKAETLMGLSGLGDLILTCSSRQSRNMSLGAALGEGVRLDDILGARRSVAEGVYTARVLARVAGGLGIDMPIVAAVNAILHQGEDVAATIEALLARPFKKEGV
ncbi:MAG: NAD(P)H-dependent glycerol-3-phosphate dehydrogenase [Pseudomonadota bacterium]